MNHIRSVALTPDGRTLAAAGMVERGGKRLPEVRLLEVPGGKVQVALPCEAPVHSVAFTPDGRSLALGSERGELRVWKDPARREDSASLAGHPPEA
jgi:WD40 repeat protein